MRRFSRSRYLSYSLFIAIQTVKSLLSAPSQRTDCPVSMSSSASSNSTEIITNAVFGITATAISVVTVWQGHRAWKLWREHAHGQRNAAPGTFILSVPNSRSSIYSRRVDIELGLQSFPSTATSLQPPAREDVVASSAPSADQEWDVVESAHTPVPQPALLTVVDAETSHNSASVQEAQIDPNELPETHPEMHNLA